MLNSFTDPDTKLQSINSVLRSRYGIEIDYSANDLSKHLSEMEQTKQSILLESKFNTYHSDPRYVKLTLICEALRIYLKEIAPRRIRRKKHSGV